MKKKRIIKVPCKVKENPNKESSCHPSDLNSNDFFKSRMNDDTLDKVSKNLEKARSIGDEFTLGLVVVAINDAKVPIELKFKGDKRPVMHDEAFHVTSMICSGSLLEDFGISLGTIVDSVKLEQEFNGKKLITIILEKQSKEVKR